MLRYVLLLLICCSASFFVYFPLTDFDIFWHLTAGRELLKTVAFFRSDPFSYSLQNAVWIDLHWFYQVLVYSLFIIGKYKAIIIGKSVLFAAALFFLFKTHNSLELSKVKDEDTRKNNWTSILVCLAIIIVLYYCRFLLDARPISITLICISLFLFCYEKYVHQPKIKYVLILGIVQIIWVNSQGLFALGIAIAGAYALGETIQEYFLTKKKIERPFFKNKPFQFWIILLFLCITCLVNPYGLKGILLPLKLFERLDPQLKNIYSTNIPENIPLLRLIGTNTEYLFWLVIICASILLLLFVLARVKIRISHILLYSGFLYLAFIAQRNVILFIFVFISLTLYYVNFLSFNINRKFIKLIQYGSLILAFVCVNFYYSHYKMLKICPKEMDFAPFNFPIHSVKTLDSLKVSGNLFNADRHGGFILWNLYPKEKVFIDTRLIIRSRQFFADYLAIIDNPIRFDSLIQVYNITKVVLPTGVIDRYNKLIYKLYRDINWSMLYADGAEVLFIKSNLIESKGLNFQNSLTRDSIEQMLVTRWQGDNYTRYEALYYWEQFEKMLIQKNE